MLIKRLLFLIIIIIIIIIINIIITFVINIIIISFPQVKRLSAIVQSGTNRGDVTAYFLQHSQDGQRWDVWSSKARATVSTAATLEKERNDDNHIIRQLQPSLFLNPPPPFPLAMEMVFAFFKQSSIQRKK